MPSNEVVIKALLKETMFFRQLTKRDPELVQVGAARAVATSPSVGAAAYRDESCISDEFSAAFALLRGEAKFILTATNVGLTPFGRAPSPTSS